MSGPPLPKEYLVPSEYAPGGLQFIPPPDTRRDPTPEEIQERARQNLVPIGEVEKRLGPATFQWMLDHKLLGVTFNGSGTKRFARFRVPTQYLQRDVVERGIEELRTIAAGLPRSS